jgi:hypothetical protein
MKALLGVTTKVTTVDETGTTPPEDPREVGAGAVVEGEGEGTKMTGIVGVTMDENLIEEGDGMMTTTAVVEVEVATAIDLTHAMVDTEPALVVLLADIMNLPPLPQAAMPKHLPR